MTGLVTGHVASTASSATATREAATTVLHLDEVTVEVLERPVLTQVSLHARAGEILLLAGRNGAGKTTLLHSALGLTPLTAGRVHRADRAERHPLPTGGTGVSFDTPALAPRATARQVIDLVAAYRGLPSPDPTTDAAVRLLALDLLDVRCSRMSHGMRQRVALAAALQGDPALVVLDEPYNGLDPASMAALSRLLRRAADRGAAVVVSSHYLAELAPVADHHVVLESGRVVLDSDLVPADSRHRHTLRVDDPARARSLLVRRGLEVKEGHAGGLEVWVAERDDLAGALAELVTHRIGLQAVIPGRPAIEQLVAHLLDLDPDPDPDLEQEQEQSP